MSKGVFKFPPEVEAQIRVDYLTMKLKDMKVKYKTTHVTIHSICKGMKKKHPLIIKDEDVVKILKSYSEGQTQREIAIKYGVHQKTIFNVVNGVTHTETYKSYLLNE